MKVLGVLLIRSGSTRLKNKNFMEFNGRPLYHWVLRAMLLSKKIDKVVISTDVPEEIDYDEGKKLIYIQRPKKLCKKNTSSEEALIWTVNEVQKSHGKYNTIILCQSTSPLLTTHHIDTALEHYLNNKARIKSLVSINSFTGQPNGAIYIVDRTALQMYGTLFTPKTGVFLMEPEDSVDIDYLYQFRIAEAIARGNVFK